MNDITSSGSYLDFNALTQLKGDAARDPSKAIRKTAEQFEAYFIQQMMKTPITVPSVFAAFVSFAKRETFLRGAWFGEAPLEALPAPPPPPLWMRNVISPSAPPPTDESCFVPVGVGFPAK